MAIARGLDQYLEQDRFMRSPREYEVGMHFVLARPLLKRMHLTQQVTHLYLETQIPTQYGESVSRARKCLGFPNQIFLVRLMAPWFA